MDELQIIQSKIYEIRGERVMLDRDIAALYNVETKVLNQAVKRNIKRFPEDFMFQLSKTEFQIWKSQIVTSNSDKMGKCSQGSSEFRRAFYETYVTYETLYHWQNQFSYREQKSNLKYIIIIIIL